MSFSILPEELVDLIADYVGSGPDVRRTARRSLLDFCLVSRQTCPSAQRVLYRQPFVYVAKYAWDRADALLKALEQNENRLGSLVRNTEGIDDWLYYLQASDNPEGEGEEGVLRRKQWYLAILRACPQLRTVELLFPPRHQDLVDLFLALSSAPPPLRNISFPYDFDDELDPEPEFDYTHVFEAFERSSIHFLDQLWFGDVDWLRGPRSTLPCFPFPVKTLTISSSSRRFANSIHLFPKDPSALRDLTFTGITDREGMDLLSLSSLVGSNLETLSMNFTPPSPEPRLLTYAQPLSSPRIRLEAFASFPTLITLDLHHTHGPSLRFLKTLAQSSPLLSRISFSSSRWIADSNSLSNDPDEIFPPVQILASLLRFRHLRSFDAGILPAVDPDRYEAFNEATRDSGIRVEYCLCAEEEEED